MQGQPRGAAGVLGHTAVRVVSDHDGVHSAVAELRLRRAGFAARGNDEESGNARAHTKNRHDPSLTKGAYQSQCVRVDARRLATPSRFRSREAELSKNVLNFAR